MVIEVYDELVKYLQDNLANCIDGLQVRVYDRMPNNITKYPVVIVSESVNANLNQTTCREEGIDSLSYRFEIYSTDLPINKEMVSSKTICREISSAIDDILGKKLGMKRNTCTPLPNIDTTVYRILMQYSTKINLYRKNLII